MNGYTGHRPMVAHNMVTTQFELDGFRVVRTMGVVRGIIVHYPISIRHYRGEPANHPWRQYHAADQSV